MQYYCGVPESMKGTLKTRSGQTRYRQWHPNHLITVGIEQPPPGFSFEDFRDVIKTILTITRTVCGVQWEYRSNWKTANIKVTTEAIDGDNGILAQAQLPGVMQSGGQLTTWNDSSMRRTRWVLNENPAPDEVDILRVDLHEIGGHNLGLGHAPQDGSPQDLMDPRISWVRTFQMDWDIPQLVARYGQPRITTTSIPTTTTAPPSPPEDERWTDLLREILRDCTQEDRETVRDLLQAWKDTGGV